MGSIPESVEREPMAIIGMATRFPQDADTVENLWSFLLRARQAMTRIPVDRMNQDAHYHPDPEHGGTVGIRFCILHLCSMKAVHVLMKLLVVPRQGRAFPL